MDLTKEQLQTLRDYKVKQDDDNIRIKEIIKKTLIEDPLIIYLLNNKELEESEADPTEYIDKNILSNYQIHPTQHNVQNFICLATDSKEGVYRNDALKIQRITFYILCEQKTNIEELTGIARHDLIGARIKDAINWSNKFGTQCELVEDLENVTDNDYATRTLIFQMETPKNIVKTRNGQSRIINKIGG